ncbi:hypothetical protein N5D25_14445, partial [Stenotrophomonas maltophilia]|uniref:hypothetical protein n=1 Tax=Stenotrophomonas maltophilia TaxID=40324 RepID=UPI002446C15E
QRFGHRAEDLLHLQRLEQAVDALPRFPWETTGASTQRFGHGAEDLLHLLRLEQAVDALPRFPLGDRGPVVPAAGRQPH